MEGPAALKARLDRLYDLYGPAYAAEDPIRFPRSYARDDDREVAGFIASALAYGRRAHIGKSVEALLGYLGDRPATALTTLDPARAARDLAGFSHRFNSGEDAAVLLLILNRLLRDHGTLNAAFLRGYDPGDADTGPALAAFCRMALATDIRPLSRTGRVPERAGVRFFFSSPESGSACKRLNMFLRWMVRRDAIDLGLWRGVPPSKLLVPVDTHVARVSRALGLTRRKTADWATAVEVTARLRELDPEDPVRYDFALYTWGLESAGGRAEIAR